MKFSKTLVSFALAGGLSAACLAQITPTKHGYSFRVKYTPGQVVKLISTTSISDKSSTITGTVQAPMTLKVLGIKKGIADVQISIGAGMLLGANKQVSAPQKMVLHLDDQNRAAGGKQAAGNIPLPSKSMTIGAKWHNILPLADGSGNVQRMDADYTFGGIQTFEGHQVAVITYSYNGFALGTGVMRLLVKDGSMYYNETHLTLQASGIVEGVKTIVKRVQ